jgi:diguanylate cyclase (GGDEF)-like protein
LWILSRNDAFYLGGFPLGPMGVRPKRNVAAMAIEPTDSRGLGHEASLIPKGASELPAALVNGLLAFSQGDFSYRMPRALNRGGEDNIAVFVNAIAEELQRIFSHFREREAKLTRSIEGLAQALTRVADGDFSAQVSRDFSGDPSDVLACLVNETIDELGRFARASERRAIDGRRQLEQLVEERTRDLQLLATTDALTGTLNRRRFFEVAEEERERSERDGHCFTLGMLDLDHFKVVNDRYGHAVGDEALRRAAEAIRRVVRRQDAVGRYGGEEFGLLFPDTHLDEAQRVCERIRVEIGRVNLRVGADDILLRVSEGVAEWRSGESVDATLQRADAALYRAKEEGRNRVVSAG